MKIIAANLFKTPSKIKNLNKIKPQDVGLKAGLIQSCS